MAATIHELENKVADLQKRIDNVEHAANYSATTLDRISVQLEKYAEQIEAFSKQLADYAIAVQKLHRTIKNQ